MNGALLDLIKEVLSLVIRLLSVKTIIKSHRLGSFKLLRSIILWMNWWLGFWDVDF